MKTRTYRTAFPLWILLCIFIALSACSADDDSQPGDAGGQLGDVADAAPDAKLDISDDDDSWPTCTTSSPCCGDDGSVSTYVQCEACPANTSYDRCTEASRCADSSVSMPECVGAEGELVEAECVNQGERDLWECPEGSSISTGDADAG